MALGNSNVIDEMNRIFEHLHARLDQRFRQLTRQVHRYSSSMNSSGRNGNTTLIFCSSGEREIDECIDSFGHLIVPTSFNGMCQYEAVSTNTTSTTAYVTNSMSSVHRQPVKKITSASGMTNENDTHHDHCRVIGRQGRHKGQFSNPQDVLMITNPNGTLLVSDTINQNVQLFSLDTGICTGTCASPSNSKQIPLRRPIGLSNSFSTNSTYLVTDYDQHLISTWTIDDNGSGKLVKKFGQKSLVGPKGLCVSNQSQRIAVADNKGNCVCLFDSSGLFLHRFGTRGAEAHELAGPHYVRFTEQDNDRHLVVTDFYNNSVKIFDIERHGQFVTSFGCIGTTNGLFQAPTGLAIDYERGLIFVSDWGNNRIQVFDRQGTFVRIIDLPSADMLYGPQGLDYEPISRTLAIANSGKHSVVLVQID